MEQAEMDARRKTAPTLALAAANKGMTEFRILSVDRHRNGCGGVGFSVVRFTFREDGQRSRTTMIGMVFDAEKCDGYCGVLRVSDVAEGTLGMHTDGAAFRGDHFEPALRGAINRYSDVYYDTLLGGPKDAYKPVNA